MLMLPPGPSRCHLVVEKLKLQQSPLRGSGPGKLDWQLRAGREQERQAVHASELEPEGGQGGVKGRSRGEDREFHAAASGQAADRQAPSKVCTAARAVVARTFGLIISPFLGISLNAQT